MTRSCLEEHTMWLEIFDWDRVKIRPHRIWGAWRGMGVPLFPSRITRVSNQEWPPPKNNFSSWLWVWYSNHNLGQVREPGACLTFSPNTHGTHLFSFIHLGYYLLCWAFIILFIYVFMSFANNHTDPFCLKYVGRNGGKVSKSQDSTQEY